MRSHVRPAFVETTIDSGVAAPAVGTLVTVPSAGLAHSVARLVEITSVKKFPLTLVSSVQKGSAMLV